MNGEVAHEEWWRDPNTVLYTLESDEGRGITNIHTKQINSTFHYAIIWWHHGTPSLQVLFVEGIVKYPKE